VGNRKNGYIEKLSLVKQLLKRMLEMEDNFSFLEEEKTFKWWKMGPIEIDIEDIEDDTYYLTVSLSPKIERKRGYAKSCIHYFYRIKGREIEREMAITLDSPTFKDKGKKVLEELASILNYGNLVLKKSDAP
jgi:hypothetical protein